MAVWIDFKQLRERIRIADLLQQHHVQLKVRGEKATGLCPLPTHPARCDGKKRSPSFSVHLGKGIWHCFGCGAKGNVLDLGARLQGLNPDDPIQLRKAALKLAETFGIECERPNGRSERPKTLERASEPTARPAPMQPAAVVDPAARIVANEPIDFELKNLNSRHPYLIDRGFTPETIDHFGLGFCSRGMMKDRIAIPVHDPIARLVGYAGRIVDDDEIDADHPRYLFPGQRKHDGVVHEFHKSMLVYNLHRLGRPVDDLIVVEGFVSVWWLHQHGYPHAVSLMGNSCSEEQARLIARHLTDEGRIWLLPDGNAAGAQLAAQALPLLAFYRFTRLLKLKDDRQPTDCDADDLARLLGARKSGTSEKPRVVNVLGTSNVKASDPMAAEQ
jgi:DNA primase